MGILNRASDGLLSALIALRRAIIAYGQQPEEKLLALCAPPSVVGATGGDRMARKTLVRWCQLGFFQEVDGVADIADDFKSIPPNDMDALRTAILRLVLDPANNPGIGEPVNEDSSSDLSGAADFTWASAWVLAQDPYTFPNSWGEVERLQNEQNIEPRPFINDTRWRGFVQWSHFLGVAWPSPLGDGVIPNPSFALRAGIQKVLGGVTDCTQGMFFESLAGALPVIDGGLYRDLVEASLERHTRPLRKDEVSPSLSLALLQLEEAGDLQLDSRADAPHRVLIGRRGRELQRVSHILLRLRS